MRGGGEEKQAQREGRHAVVIPRKNINNTNLTEEFKEDPRTKGFKPEEETKRGFSPSYRLMSEDHRKYIGVFDEDLNGCID